MEEIIRRLGAQFELTRDFFQLQDAEGNRDLLDRSCAEPGLTSRALRWEWEQNQAIPPPEDVVDLTQDRAEQCRFPPLTYRRGQSHRGFGPPSDRLVEAYLQEQQPLSMDDRDSFSSIAAVIHGESQTVDTAVEIDSVVSLSTSSSRQRHDPSRALDVDSGDSRALRRRRLN